MTNHVGNSDLHQVPSTMEDKIQLLIKWSGKEFKIEEFPVNETVLELKEAIHKLTGVLPARQKLLNVKNKGKEK